MMTPTSPTWCRTPTGAMPTAHRMARSMSISSSRPTSKAMAASMTVGSCSRLRVYAGRLQHAGRWPGRPLSRTRSAPGQPADPLRRERFAHAFRRAEVRALARHVDCAAELRLLPLMTPDNPYMPQEIRDAIIPGDASGGGGTAPMASSSRVTTTTWASTRRTPRARRCAGCSPQMAPGRQPRVRDLVCLWRDRKRDHGDQQPTRGPVGRGRRRGQWSQRRSRLPFIARPGCGSGARGLRPVQHFRRWCSQSGRGRLGQHGQRQPHDGHATGRVRLVVRQFRLVLAAAGRFDRLRRRRGYRKEESDSDPAQEIADGLTWWGPITPSGGSFDVTECSPR